MDETHSLSSHELQPPGLQSMRMIFKKYQKLKTYEIDSDHAVLDSGKLRGAAGVEESYSIPSSRLSMIFGQFMQQNAHGEHKVDVTVYSCSALPGLLIAPALLPPQIQYQLLSRLIHRDLSDPKHQTNLHLHYEIPYPSFGQEKSQQKSTGGADPMKSASFFSYPPSSSTVFNPKDPSVHRPLTISKVMHKSLRWMTLGRQYNWTKKLYPKEEPPSFPPDIKDLLESLFPGTKAQAAIVNFYSPGDTLSLHRDISEECDRGLISVSLGCDGLFMIGSGSESNASDTLILRLRSGDVVYMTRESRFAYHSVPKIIPRTCPMYLTNWPADQEEIEQYEEWRGWMSNKRINLNVRQMYD